MLRFTYMKYLITTLFIGFLFIANLSFAQEDSIPPQGGGEPAADLALGEKLFKNNCASCHNYNEQKLVGPGLAGILERRTMEWLIPWVQNSQAVIASGDDYAVALYEEYDQAQMQAFPNLSDEDVIAIISYVDYASKNAATETADEDGGETTENGQTKESGIGNYFFILLGVLITVLVLIVVVLLMMLSILTRYLNQNDENLSEEEKEVLGQKFNFGKILQSRPVIIGASLFFALVITKATLDGLLAVGIQQGYAPKQPISFSHKLHAGEYEIECQYCHTGVNKGKSATIPSANICMNCHNEIKRTSPEIQKIYTAIQDNKPIEWVRIHNLQDFVYFNHSQHVEVGGLACQTCHGEIQEMEVVEQRSTLTMGWCIDCHRQTVVKAEGNEYYDRLLEFHKDPQSGNYREMVVENIGGLECSKCHY